jgi:hypothetical protein
MRQRRKINRRKRHNRNGDSSHRSASFGVNGTASPDHSGVATGRETISTVVAGIPVFAELHDGLAASSATRRQQETEQGSARISAGAKAARVRRSRRGAGAKDEAAPREGLGPHALPASVHTPHTQRTEAERYRPPSDGPVSEGMYPPATDESLPSPVRELTSRFDGTPIRVADGRAMRAVRPYLPGSNGGPRRAREV